MIFVYHFDADDNPPATLARDHALVPGAEVTIFGGSNGDTSSCGLYRSIIDLIPVGGPIGFSGISAASALWVDRDGNLFIHSVEASIRESDP